MRPDELVFAVRVEETHPTDRVRGTVVNIDSSGMFVIKYDNGDYLAYQPDDISGFHTIPGEPIPPHAMTTIRGLYARYGRTPPEDVLKLEKAIIPGQARMDNAPSGEAALTGDVPPPSIEA